MSHSDWSPPPPQYSAKVFDGLLRTVFEGQARIRGLLSDLQGLRVDDQVRKIQFDCSEFLREHEDRCSSLLQPFVVLPSGTFGEETRAQIQGAITSRQREVDEALRLLQGERDAFASKKDDHDAFVAYEQHYQHVLESFQQFQKRVCAYIAEYFGGEDPVAVARAQKEVMAAAPQIHHGQFRAGFRRVAEREEHAADEAVEASRRAVDRIRAATAKGSSPTPAVRHGAAPAAQPVSDEDVEKLTRQIERRIATLAEEPDRAACRDRLTRLQRNTEFVGDPYYYRDLHDSVLALATTRRLQAQTAAALGDIPAAGIHPSLRAKHASLAVRIRKFLSQPCVKVCEADALRDDLAALAKESREVYAAEFVAERERDFLRRQLCHSLIRLGYEVVEDTAAADLAKPGDVFLRIPDQDNIVHLEFRADGHIIHRFLIPEARDELSLEAKHQRVQEMARSCQTFQCAVDELRAIGVPIPAPRDTPASEKALIQVPAKYRAKLKTTGSRPRSVQRTDQQQLRVGSRRPPR
jgi:hypothetical protein